MIFQFMEKHRVKILLAVLFAMVGFGVWSFIIDSLGSRSRDDGDPSLVVATFNLDGESIEVTKGEMEEHKGTNPSRVDNMTENQAAAILAALVREKIIAKSPTLSISTKVLQQVLEAQNRDSWCVASLSSRRPDLRAGASPSTWITLCLEKSTPNSTKWQPGKTTRPL